MRTQRTTHRPIPPPPTSRRAFITAGLAAAGLGPAISALHGCGDPPDRPPRQRATPPPTRTGESVLVIGAGIAGLAAASELRASGFEDIVVLEARDRIGGRIWTANLGGTVPIDLGASWIHGVRGNPIAEVARRSGIETRPTDWDNAVLHFHQRAAPTSDTPDLDGFWTLAQTRPRTSLRSILDNYLETRALSATQRRYLEHLLNTTVEHEYGADLADLSLESVDGGGEYGGSDVLFPGGYGQIVDALADGLDVRLRQAVTGIDHTGATVVATTASGATFEADRIVVTLPLGVLKKSLADREIVAEATAALADMYGPVPQPTDALVTRWGSDPWTNGSYSYVPVGSSFERYAALGEPIGNTVFFAGEATDPDHPATVHGACLSGVRAAREIAAAEVG